MIKHKKLVEQLRNRDHCKNCPYTEDCESCLIDLLAADAIEDLSIQIEKLEKWIKDNYKQYATDWTWERSDGNACDVFEDGYIVGTSWAAYEIGCMLGMELEKPNEPECVEE